MFTIGKVKKKKGKKQDKIQLIIVFLSIVLTCGALAFPKKVCLCNNSERNSIILQETSNAGALNSGFKSLGDQTGEKEGCPSFSHAE